PVYPGGFSRPTAPDEKARLAREHRRHAARGFGNAQDRRFKQERTRVSPNGGDHLRYDAEGAQPSPNSQCAAAFAHRQGERCARLGSEQSAQSLQSNAGNDEEDGQVSEDDGADGWGDSKRVLNIGRKRKAPAPDWEAGHFLASNSGAT